MRNLTLRWLTSARNKFDDRNEYELYRATLFGNKELQAWLKYEEICQAYSNGFVKVELSVPVKELFTKKVEEEVLLIM